MACCEGTSLCCRVSVLLVAKAKLPHESDCLLIPRLAAACFFVFFATEGKGLGRRVGRSCPGHWRAEFRIPLSELSPMTEMPGA